VTEADYVNHKNSMKELINRRKINVEEKINVSYVLNFLISIFLRLLINIVLLWMKNIEDSNIIFFSFNASTQ
jgi:hypothetical protein